MSLYAHSALQRVKTSGLVANTLHPLMKRYVYCGDAYVTQDEHKIDEDELGHRAQDLCRRLERTTLRNPAGQDSANKQLESTGSAR